jgi:hypothetical protein
LGTIWYVATFQHWHVSTCFTLVQSQALKKKDKQAEDERQKAEGNRGLEPSFFLKLG